MAITHGVGYFMKTGKLNPAVKGHRKLKKYIQSIEDDLIKEHGGRENLSVKEEILIKGTVSAYTIILLATMYTQEHGIFSPDKLKKGEFQLQNVLNRSMVSYWNVIRLNLLGLDNLRKSGQKRDELDEYITKKYGKRERSSLKTPLIEAEAVEPDTG